ncbi:MAG: transposase, partial [Proteobacteria bacterium]
MMQYQGFSAAFFDVHLPDKWSCHLEADSLTLSNETHLDKQLQKTMSDLVFTCRIKGQTSYLCLLVEHQSTPDKMMAFRMMDYVFGVLRSALKRHPDRPLPPVYGLL